MTETQETNVTPLLDRAGVTDSNGAHPMEAFIGDPMPVEVDDELHIGFVEYIDSAEDVIRATYDRIGEHLELLRTQRELLNNQIAELVEKQRIWEPIVNRLDTGIRHRKPKEELTPLELGV